MGLWHATYARRAGARIAAVVDADRSRAESLAARFGAKAYAPSEPWLTQLACDVVHVCTPLGSHDELARNALMHGKHVIVEKPLTVSLAATEQLFALSRERGLLLVPVHQFPFQRGFRELRARLPELGTPFQIDFSTSTAGAEGRTGQGRRDVLLEILPHPVSLFHALGFRVPLAAFRIERFDEHALELSAAAGPTRLGVRMLLDARPTSNELRVLAERGSATVDLFHGFAVIDRADTSRASKVLRPFRMSAATALKASVNLAGRALRREPAYPGLKELIAACYDAIRAGQAAPISSEETLYAAGLADKVRAHVSS